jgi:hypothetical protein
MHGAHSIVIGQRNIPLAAILARCEFPRRYHRPYPESFALIAMARIAEPSPSMTVMRGRWRSFSNQRRDGGNPSLVLPLVHLIFFCVRFGALACARCVMSAQTKTPVLAGAMQSYATSFAWVRQVEKNSTGRTRTYNIPVNSGMLYH